MFHLHHGVGSRSRVHRVVAKSLRIQNIDRLWWLWQEKSKINKLAFHGGSVQVESRSFLKEHYSDIFYRIDLRWMCILMAKLRG
jgi:hypothetical protein